MRSFLASRRREHPLATLEEVAGSREDGAVVCEHGNESRQSEVRNPCHEHRGARWPSGFDAMESAHRLGIVRRDLKPENVMVLTEPGARVA